MIRSFYPSSYEDMRDAVDQSLERGLNNSRKQLAMILWPKSNRASSALSEALKDNRLTALQIIEICKFTGRLDPLYFLCDQLGLGRPKSLASLGDPVVEMQEVKALFNDAKQSLAAVGSRLHLLEDRI
ncbi:hypothetical protein ACQZV8_12195 [Magnetococcales bacterium HHB-1]